MNAPAGNITTDTLQLLAKLLEELERISPRLAQRKYADLTPLLDGLDAVTESINALKQTIEHPIMSSNELGSLETALKNVLLEFSLSVETGNDPLRAKILTTDLPAVLNAWRVQGVSGILNSISSQSHTSSSEANL